VVGGRPVLLFARTLLFQALSFTRPRVLLDVANGSLKEVMGETAKESATVSARDKPDIGPATFPGTNSLRTA
jgi:hypothetical protein